VCLNRQGVDFTSNACRRDYLNAIFKEPCAFS